MKQKQYWGMALVILCLPLLKVLTVSALGIGSCAPLLQSDALGWMFPLVRLGFFMLLWLAAHGLALCLNGRGLSMASLVFVPLMYTLHWLFLFLGAWVWWSPVTTYGLPLILLAAAGLAYLSGRRSALIKQTLLGLVALFIAIVIIEATGLELRLFFWAALAITVLYMLGRVVVQSDRPGWRGFLLALTVISVGIAVTSFLPGTGSVCVPELSEEQQVQAAVFRHMLGERGGQVYLSLENNTDPDPALLRSLADLPVRIFGGSRALKVRIGNWDRLTLERGTWYYISKFEWLGAERVQVEWGSYYAPLGGRGGTLFLEKTTEGWQVVGESYREWMS